MPPLLPDDDGRHVWMNTSTRESPTAAVDMSGPTPPPWFHDVENNRHWDPGHGHWHDGPPPAHATQPPSALMAPLRAPEPWEYDAANNRHWHPGHNHWHAGPPPQMPETTPEVPSETTPEAPAGGAGQWLPDAPPGTPPTP